MRTNRYGFSLIELLVAATIIGILSTIGVAGFQAVTRNGRDALRKSDLEQIRSALEIYKAENNNYPDDSNCTVPTLEPDYINPYPEDPKADFIYCYNRQTALTYDLCAHLENGGADNFAECAASCGNGPCNYKVSNP